MGTHAPAPPRLASSHLHHRRARHLAAPSVGRDERAEREERYRLAALGSGDGLWDWHLDTGLFYLCPRWHDMLGLRRADTPGRSQDWLDRVHADDRASLQLALNTHLSGHTSDFRHEHRLRHDDGGYRWTLCRGRAARQPNGTPTRITGTFTDVTEWANTRETLRHSAFHDSLTGLANRALFLPLLAETIALRRRQPDREFAVLFLDLDRFKTVNDVFGHSAGDELLIAVARRLRAAVRGGDTAARYGGDEFTLLLNGVDGAGQAREIAERLQLDLRPPYFIAGRELPVTVSIGVALGGAGPDGPEGLLHAADAAMYQAKAAGDQRPVFHEPADDRGAGARAGAPPAPDFTR